MQPELQWPCQELPGHPSLSQKQLYPTNKWNNGTNAATKLEPKPNMTKKPMKTQGEQPTPQHCPGERHERFQHNTTVLVYRCTKLYKQCINSKHQCAASLQLVNFILWRCPPPYCSKATTNKAEQRELKCHVWTMLHPFSSQQNGISKYTTQTSPM